MSEYRDIRDAPRLREVAFATEPNVSGVNNATRRKPHAIAGNVLGRRDEIILEVGKRRGRQ